MDELEIYLKGEISLNINERDKITLSKRLQRIEKRIEYIVEKLQNTKNEKIIKFFMSADPRLSFDKPRVSYYHIKL